MRTCILGSQVTVSTLRSKQDFTTSLVVFPSQGNCPYSTYDTGAPREHQGRKWVPFACLFGVRMYEKTHTLQREQFSWSASKTPLLKSTKVGLSGYHTGEQLMLFPARAGAIKWVRGAERMNFKWLWHVWVAKCSNSLVRASLRTDESDDTCDVNAKPDLPRCYEPDCPISSLSGRTNERTTSFTACRTPAFHTFLFCGRAPWVRVSQKWDGRVRAQLLTNSSERTLGVCGCVGGCVTCRMAM